MEKKKVKQEPKMVEDTIKVIDTTMDELVIEFLHHLQADRYGDMHKIKLAATALLKVIEKKNEV